MSKRNKYVEMSPEAQALKELRNEADLSLRKLAQRMRISFTRAHQMESGREDIPESYVRKFLIATEFSWTDWTEKLGERDELSDVRERCHELIDLIDSSKLEAILGVLKNF